MNIILASKSPRRKELLSKVFPRFEIMVSEADETLPEGESLECGVAVIAERKGQAVYEKLCRELGKTVADGYCIISSDTLVEVDGEPLGKPRDKAEAYGMIEKLSGREHYVRTGVAINFGGVCRRDTASTKVVFRKLTEREIEEYVSSEEPYDKAGGYGIQGAAGRFVDRIEGDYDTVVGLSLSLVLDLLERVKKDSNRLFGE